MSESTIYSTLRRAGLTAQGACGLMGNMYAESLLMANNVEDRSGISDATYTQQVDTGTRSKEQFMRDSYGYGLCQWTYYTRKAALYEYAKSLSKSIGDEAMQADFCVKEIKEEYPSLYTYLCQTTDLYTATSRVCTEYERPAYNNIGARYSYASAIYGRCSGLSVSEYEQPTSSATTAVAATTVQAAEYSSFEAADMPVLKQGDKGVAVGMAQYALNKQGYSLTPDCDFGSLTLAALNQFKSKHGLTGNAGKIDAATWEELYK